MPSRCEHASKQQSGVTADKHCATCEQRRLAGMARALLHNPCALAACMQGWDEGVRTMKKGEKALLTCRSDYAYGKAGSPPKIPADATLNFEVSLRSVDSESWRAGKQ